MVAVKIGAEGIAINVDAADHWQARGRVDCRPGKRVTAKFNAGAVIEPVAVKIGAERIATDIDAADHRQAGGRVNFRRSSGAIAKPVAETVIQPREKGHAKLLSDESAYMQFHCAVLRRGCFRLFAGEECAVHALCICGIHRANAVRPRRQSGWK